MSIEHSLQARRVCIVGQVGIEPTTHGLKVRCSTTELLALRAKYLLILPYLKRTLNEQGLGKARKQARLGLAD